MLIAPSPAIFESADLDQTSTDDIVVRSPSESDVSGLAALFSEMQCHYGRPVSDATAAEAARLACTPPVGTFDPRVLIALTRGLVVGSIVMNVTFPAFELTLSLHIRDLYVAKAGRDRTDAREGRRAPSGQPRLFRAGMDDRRSEYRSAQDVRDLWSEAAGPGVLSPI
jgi:hypothetical protein